MMAFYCFSSSLLKVLVLKCPYVELLKIITILLFVVLTTNWDRKEVPNRGLTYSLVKT